jgi:hypothetical protein
MIPVGLEGLEGVEDLRDMYDLEVEGTGCLG